MFLHRDIGELPRLFDTHCHLDKCSDGALEDAVAAGVQRLVVPSIGRDSWARVVELAASPHVLCALGIHPEALDDLDGLEGALRGGNAVAVGEIGLDRRLPHWDRQRVQFRAQLRIADACGLPVLVHCVRAHDALVAELRDVRAQVPIVLHAYSGSAELVPVYAKLGCYFSFAGTVTWSGSRRGPKACAAVPAQRLLIETDAPYLSPQSRRGVPSAPAWLPEIAAAVAVIRGVDLAAIAAVTTANAERVFCA